MGNLLVEFEDTNPSYYVDGFIAHSPVMIFESVGQYPIRIHYVQLYLSLN